MPVACTLMLASGAAHAQYGDGGAPASGGSSGGSTTGSTTFDSYIDVMFNTEFSQDDDVQTVTTGGGLLGGGSTKTYDPVLDQANGISVLAGFRRKGWYGFEVGFGYSKDGEADVQKQSAQFNTLFYPFEESNLYLKLALGVTRYVEYPIERSDDPIPDGDDDFLTANYGGGVGYVLPIEFGETSLGIRAEAVYLVGDRFLERENDFEEDIRAPGTLKEVQFNIGVRFPL
ncbi:hypothetical protein GCM10027567_08790 [Spongiibacter taiwanensis]